MTFSGLSYLFSNFVWIWLLIAFIGGLIWGWMTCDKSGRASSWFGRGFWLWIIVLAVGIIVAYLKLIPGRAGLWFDNAVLFATTYFVGCCLGCWIRKLIGGEAALPAAAAVAAPVAVAAAVPKPAAPVAPALATIKPYLWQAQKEGAQVTLTGYVPSADVRGQMVDAAGKTFGAANVIDKLQLGAGAPAGLALLGGAAFGHLSKLDRGIASLVDSAYTLTGQAPSTANKDAAETAAGMLPSGFRLSKADVVAPVVKAVPTPVVEAPKPAPRPAPKVEAKPAPKPAPKPVAKAAVAAAAVPVAAAALAPEEPPAEKGRPKGLKGPRGGKPDDLKRIRGIGKQNEGRLHGLGTWHFDQIAAWSKEEVEWVGNFLAFPGRIEREEWVSQAKVLATGADTEFSKRVARGEVATSIDTGKDIGQGNVAKLGADGFEGKRPRGLPAPRPGKKDDLKLINGVGPVIEGKLHAVGIFHFDQIAAMSDDELAWISFHVGHPGRAIRENWKDDSATLASGKDTEHSKALKAKGKS
jgi:predicted flap endonuclease-1-like 5' DNA nuclease